MPTFLAVVGVGLLLFASVNLVLEALEALRTNRLEIRFYRELHERRGRAGDGQLSAARTARAGSTGETEVERSSNQSDSRALERESDHDVLEAADAELRGLSPGPAEQADPLRGRPAGDVLALPLPGLVPVRPTPDLPDHGGHDLLPGGLYLLSAAGLAGRPAAAPVHADALVAGGLGRAVAVRRSVSVFLATFVLGWIIQLVGHAIEGRRPALADNILQVFNAPLFLTIEVLSLLGFRHDLCRRPSRVIPNARADQIGWNPSRTSLGECVVLGEEAE